MADPYMHTLVQIKIEGYVIQIVLEDHIIGPMRYLTHWSFITTPGGVTYKDTRTQLMRRLTQPWLYTASWTDKLPEAVHDWLIAFDATGGWGRVEDALN